MRQPWINKVFFFFFFFFLYTGSCTGTKNCMHFKLRRDHQNSRVYHNFNHDTSYICLIFNAPILS